MPANYHTHSYHCKHASGSAYEYVEEAIKNGLDILGFSDHVPYPFPEDYFSHFRMRVDETEQYASEIAEVKEKYKDKIKIHTGYEAEFYPKYFEKMLTNLKKYGCDYLILGQHCTNNEYDGNYSVRPCNQDIFKTYVNQVIEGMKTGMFSYVAHPDVINYREDLKLYKKEMEKLCEASLLYDVPLEFNLLGFKEKRHYPYNEFWELVSKVGAKAVIGWDAHSPEQTGAPKFYNKALKELDKYGIKPIEKLTLKKI